MIEVWQEINCEGRNYKIFPCKLLRKGELFVCRICGKIHVAGENEAPIETSISRNGEVESLQLPNNYEEVRAIYEVKAAELSGLKRDEVIKMVDDAGLNDGEIESFLSQKLDITGVPVEFRRLVNSVLERAAVELEGAWHTAEAAESIRALKINTGD